MRTLGGFCIAHLCAGGLFAQHHPGGGGSPSHFSNNPGFARRPGTGPIYSHPVYAYPVYAYPFYMGGFYDNSAYGYGYSPYGYSDSSAAIHQQPNVTVVYPQQPATASPVIINMGAPGQNAPQGPAAPPESFYQGPAQPSPEESAAAEPTHYLIALKDHTIYSAVAYWVDGSTLHYFTSGNTHNQISLSLVDRDLTQRLNKGSGLEVNLPPGK